MNTLREQQQAFLAYLLQGDPAIGSAIVDQAPVGRDLRLGIYANAYRQRLIETLETDHEVLGSYLGDALWDPMADAYIKAQPSKFRSLRQYGDALPAWLRANAPYAEHPQIAELADFERRLLTSFDAADSQRASIKELAELPPQSWPSLTLRLHPSVQRFAATTNSVLIWQAIKAGQTPPDPVADETVVWLLWRGDDRLTQFRSMSQHESLLLDHFLSGGDFATACELLAAQLDADAVAARALDILNAWLATGLVRELV